VLFDILGDSVREGPVLDLYAGSGALGLEALSRGAPEAVFVEERAGTRQVLMRNCRALEALDRCRILGMPVLLAVRRLLREEARFRLVLADPPYGDPEIPRLLEILGAPENRLLGEGCGLVLECRIGDPLPERAGGLRLGRSKRIGGTELRFYQQGEEIS